MQGSNLKVYPIKLFPVSVAMLLEYFVNCSLEYMGARGQERLI